MGLISYLTTIRFEAGASRQIGQDLAELGVARPLIVTDRGVVAAGLVERISDSAPALRSAPVFQEVPTNPTQAAASGALETYRQHGCDGIVAIGGGSPMDLAKALALLATHDGPLAQYAAILGGLPKITSRVTPVVAVPTTAGTGSEVGRAALITLNDGRKLGFISPYLIPKRAVCDPELTVGLPPLLTAATGMDAVTHCIETFLSPRDNPPAEAIALDGLARAVSHLERAVAHGGDLHARKEMMMAALEGGLTFQKGLGAVHSLSHALGALSDLSLHHGTLNAVLLPAVLRYNEPAATEKYHRIRRAAGLPRRADLARFIEDLNGRLGLPANLRAMGVPRDALPGMAQAAMADHSTPSNARVVDAAAFEDLLQGAF